MRRKLVVGNWKMHGTKELVPQLIEAIDSVAASFSENVEIAVCPTHLHLSLVAQSLKSGAILLGAQNGHQANSGAFTGEVSLAMLKEYGVTFVIVGHSERRQIFSENDSLIAEKFVATQAAGLIPILCVGESLQQREAGTTEQHILSQLDAVLEVAGIEAFANAVVAYEPIWAIGTGQTASPEQAQEVHNIIRMHLGRLSASVAENLRILYGGSVNDANAAELFDQADIDGGLIGGASLQAEKFISICKSAD